MDRYKWTRRWRFHLRVMSEVGDKKMKQEITLLIGFCLAVGCSRHPDNTDLPGTKVVQNGEYSLHVKTWTNGESMVELRHAGRTVYFGSGYDSNKFDGTICISTNLAQSIFFKDDYRNVGHGSLLLDGLDKSSGCRVTFIDLDIDGVWDRKTIHGKPKETPFVRIGSEWVQRLDESHGLVDGKTVLILKTNDEWQVDRRD